MDRAVVARAAKHPPGPRGDELYLYAWICRNALNGR